MVVAPDGSTTICTRLGDYIVDLRLLAEEGVLEFESLEEAEDLSDLCTDPEFPGLGELRKAVYGVFRQNNPKLRDDKELRELALLPADEAPLVVPFQVGAFVDFYSGIQHASNVGKMFRPDQDPLLPNYRHLPVGYNGRASSVVVSGEPIHRPNGQTKGPNDEAPKFGPTKELDFELEMGFFLGKGSELSEVIPMSEAEASMAGMVLVNDWSARDVQRWEYQPLGPFLAKSFATSISPWVVTLDALEPFRCHSKHSQEPEPLDYLKRKGPQHFDIQLEVSLQTQKMSSPQVIALTNYNELYWSAAQQLVHQSSNGTPLEPGDLYATGTISGADPNSFGSMLELSWKGTKPISLTETGETRTFLEDGDTLSIKGWCQGDGFRVGFGEVSGTIG